MEYLKNNIIEKYSKLEILFMVLTVIFVVTSLVLWIIIIVNLKNCGDTREKIEKREIQYDANLYTQKYGLSKIDNVEIPDYTYKTEIIDKPSDKDNCSVRCLKDNGCNFVTYDNITEGKPQKCDYKSSLHQTLKNTTDKTPISYFLDKEHNVMHWNYNDFGNKYLAKTYQVTDTNECIKILKDNLHNTTDTPYHAIAYNKNNCDLISAVKNDKKSTGFKSHKIVL